MYFTYNDDCIIIKMLRGVKYRGAVRDFRKGRQRRYDTKESKRTDVRVLYHSAFSGDVRWTAGCVYILLSKYGFCQCANRKYRPDERAFF